MTLLVSAVPGQATPGVFEPGSGVLTVPAAPAPPTPVGHTAGVALLAADGTSTTRLLADGTSTARLLTDGTSTVRIMTT